MALTWYEAAKYCRWLSEQEGIPEDQMCYPPMDQIKEGMKPPENYQARTGYRLPTQAEWEYACRARASTRRFYGDAEGPLPHYAWFIANSAGRAQPVGRLMPNDFGLFDVLGNAWEWCEDSPDPRDPAARVLRGGSFALSASRERGSMAYPVRADQRIPHTGFRVARTVR
jgi:formylglycine-generating enzyme required for sulfatase activity